MIAEVVTDLTAVRELVPRWRELLADSSGDEVVLSPEWLLTWWDVFAPGSDRQLRFVTFRDEDRLIGLAPLQSRRHWYRPGLPFRRLELLASGEREQDAICTDYLNILARNGHEADVASALIEQLRAGRLGGWDELVIPLMDGNGQMPGLLAQAARRMGLLASIEETTKAPYIPLPQSWEEYLRLLGRKERYLINRTLRDFEQWAGNDWSLEVATTATLKEGQKILLSLHHERWQGAGAGVFRSPLFLAFHDRVLPLLLQRGAVELIWLIVRGMPVAVMYNWIGRGKISFYQCGRKLDLPRAIRPGGVLLYLAIRRAIEAGCNEFDFLGGEALYKKQLALASRSLVQLRVSRRCLVERVRVLLERGKDIVRPIWHRLRKGAAPAATIDDGN